MATGPIFCPFMLPVQWAPTSSGHSAAMARFHSLAKSSLGHFWSFRDPGLETVWGDTITSCMIDGKLRFSRVT